MSVRLGRLTLRVFRSWHTGHFTTRRRWQLDIGPIEIEWTRR